MANAPFPLFCSTPPPIDDEVEASPVNDDDDFGDFADAYQENLNNYMENSGDNDFTDFRSGVPQFLGHASNEPSKAPISIEEKDFPEQNIPETDLNCDFINANNIEILKRNDNANKSTQEVDFDSQMTNDHTTSLSSLSEQQTSSATSISPVSKSPTPKIEIRLDDDDKDFGEFQFDKSIDVAKSDSGRSTENDSISNEAGEKSRTLPALSNAVVLEDLVDDSSDDERLSSRNRNTINCDESSSDYFAIHPVEHTEKEEEVVQNSVWSACNNVSLSMGATETELQLSVPQNSSTTGADISTSEIAASPAATNVEMRIETTQVETVAETKMPKVDITCDNKLVESSLNVVADTNDIDDDFANFQDFSSAPAMQSTWPINTENVKQQKSETSLQQLTQSSETSSLNETVSEDKIDNDDDDDDDFGDFSVAPVIATSQVQISTQSAIPVVKQHLSEHLKPMLELMFPIVSTITETTSTKSSTLQQQSSNTTISAPMELALVESAKALEYQWTGSFVRHAFIKSLGIDSRNIFLTEKWNPAMPRFAANLSFDPLQPLKPTSVPLQPETVSSTTNNSKADVPVAEFDWKTSGLVNPLDASHVHTLLLDVDQLVVVANLDNINLDSSSSCSQSSSSTSTSICTLTTSTSTATVTSTYVNGTNNINGKMVKTTETAATKMMSKIHNTNADNGTIVNAFHGDNLQLFSIDNETLCTDSNASGTAFQCPNNDIIDLHDTGNVNVLLSTNVDFSQNNCYIPHPTHYHNNNNNNNINNINFNNDKNKNNNNNYYNNNNANTSLAVLNTIDTICFDASVTTASAFNLLLPNTSVAFTNNLQFNELHHSLAGQTSSNLTPLSSSTITTTTTTTTTKPTITEITNIAHHFKNMQMQMSTVSTSQCLNTNLYREPRPQTEMASQSIDASKAESSVPSVIENKNNASTGNTDSSTETPTVAASTAGGTLPPTITGGGNIDGSDNNFSNNIDIGLYDMLNSKSSTELPKEVVFTQIESINMDENPIKAGKDSQVLDAVGCVTNESSSITLDVYNMDGDAEVRIENGVISRSTFAGPLKETHIFTPSKNMPDLYDNKNVSTLARTASPATTTGCAPKVFPVDFDYEKAAAGIIIDETVVHKEYRDVEYNPGFGFDESHMQRVESPAPKALSTLTNNLHTQQQHEDFDDEFTDFQSVPAPEPMRTVEKLSTPTAVNGMILSPAILLPQAISIENKQPKIEWGDSATNIDPDELARIEQLFPQDNNSRNSSKKSTPTHAVLHSNSLSISATIAKQTQEHVVDDDDWSDFVSVPVPATNRISQRSPQKSKLETNDDEWSDFVSSAPNTQSSIASNARVAPTTASYAGMPQFNSASWQNANFYNNPLSVYHRNQMNAVPNPTPTKLQNNNYSNYNNNNLNNQHNYRNNGNNNFTQYLPNNTTKQKLPQQQQQQQKIQVMQDFSTASSDFNSYRPRMPQSNYAGPTNTTNTHFQVGSAKVAPTVSLIPDLGFVAPAMPVHTAIINALPKASNNSKK